MLNIMCYVYDLILNKQLIEMFTCNTDITACIVVTVAEVPPSYISTSVFGDLLSQSCDIILDHMYFFVFFPVNQIGRTEMILNNLNPKFAKKFVLDYYFEMVQKMKFSVYDIDNDTHDLSDDDFLGELECTLGQVSFALYSSERELCSFFPLFIVLRQCHCLCPDCL